jgi:site-specific DNA-methyltransferase (adenine-specific)
MSWEVREGDCLEAMKEMTEGSVDAIVTDPPYGLEFMGKEWDKLGAGVEATAKSAGGFGKNSDTNENAFAAARVRYGSSPVEMGEWHRAWATEALRILKPGGYLLAFGGTRTYHRLACGIEDAGFEVRDCLAWAYGSGFPKSHNLDGKWQGWGTALKPAYEPVVLARKPLTGTVAANVQEFGTGALNIDGGRVGTEVTVTTNGKGFGGSFEGGTNDQGGKQTAGRWPANLILDPEAGAMLDEQAGREVSRFFYCAKASRAERNAGLDGMPQKRGGIKNDSGRGFSESDTYAEILVANHHPTVKPIDLMRYLVRLVTPPGGTVLDPFTGSGTTGIAANLEGFDFIGIEREAEYREIAEARLRWWDEQNGEAEEPLTLFGEAA